jgi:hypothetical protein
MLMISNSFATLSKICVQSQVTSANCGLPTPYADNTALSNILGIAFGAIGALALLMITISGFRYILSAGDPQKMSKAKNALIYSLVGLAIAVAAESIVGFVAGSL